MSSHTTLLRCRPLLGAVLTCMLFSGALAAQDRMVTVAVPVSARGLDLTQARDAQAFYLRLEQAARAVCTSGNRVDLTPVEDFADCYEKALGGAVRSANAPLIAQIYLHDHTLEEAVVQRVEILARMAAR